jgi:hypothetical protein
VTVEPEQLKWRNEKMSNLLRKSAVCLALTTGAVVFAQGPDVNIGTRHGNLQAAQQYIVAAYERTDDAQRANHGQLGGRAAELA